MTTYEELIEEAYDEKDIASQKENRFCYDLAVKHIESDDSELMREYEVSGSGLSPVTAREYYVDCNMTIIHVEVEHPHGPSFVIQDSNVTLKRLGEYDQFEEVYKNDVLDKELF